MRTVVWGARGYAVVLGIVLLARVAAQDRTPLLFALDSLLHLFFLPLPAVLVAGAVVRSKDVLAIFSGCAVVWLWLWGGLFVPRSPEPMTANSLRVMSYNVLGYNRDVEATLRTLRAADADVVALQELNPENAAAIESEASGAYPHRWLDPRDGVAGGGILSRYPFRRVTPSPLPDLSWVGTPMVIELELGDSTVTVVRFHATSGPAAVQVRDGQARALADLARGLRGPSIFLGDLNATDQNVAHAILERELRDAWREVGLGFGHTFPGRPTAATGGSRPVVLGVPVPLWLVRIDYVWHSEELTAVDASVGPYDGASDHRPVVATLGLR